MREGSFGTRTVKIVLDTAQKYEAKTRLLELRKVGMPLFNPDSDSEFQNAVMRIGPYIETAWSAAYTIVIAYRN